MNLHYKIQPVSDHAAKFHGDRPRDLIGERVAKYKEKHHGQNRRPPVAYYRTGGLIMLMMQNMLHCSVV